MDRGQLETAGMDVDAALARLMGNEMLLERVLQVFAGDTNMAALEAASHAGDARAGLEAAHALKGVCGNLSMTTLFDLCSRQCDLFRAGDSDAAFALVPQIAEAHRAMLEAVRG